MRKINTLLAGICLLAMGQSCPAATIAVSGTPECPEIIHVRDADSPMRETREIKGLLKYRIPQDRTRADDGDFTFRDLTVSSPGELAGILGDEILEVDSLKVSGPIGADDFRTLWRASYEGRLSAINLRDAAVENGRIPDWAFIDIYEQLSPDAQYINVISLRHIILPEGLTEIGVAAFSYATLLEKVEFPSTLRRIDRNAFNECIRLKADPLVFPEGFEEIGYLAFLDCREINGRVVLPRSMRTIGGGAFFHTRITECNFPDGLETIGDAAFYGTHLREAILPETGVTFTGDSHFSSNQFLTKVRPPRDMTSIPSSFVYYCRMLSEFTMPDKVTTIGGRAFEDCVSLTELRMPPGLESIEWYGLSYCSGLRSISLPASLQSLGAESCAGWGNIREIYCAAKVPPFCHQSNFNPGYSPFGKYGSGYGTHAYIPVYVPVGSAELYRDAWGWDYFTNYIETDSFPSSDIRETDLSSSDEKEVYYSLQGMPVSDPRRGEVYILRSPSGSRKVIF